MNQLQAFRDTVALAEERGMPDAPGSDLGLEHLRAMLVTIERAEYFSAAKLGRWLGWAQCAVVAAGVATLEEMKALNARYLDDPSADVDVELREARRLLSIACGALGCDASELDALFGAGGGA